MSAYYSHMGRDALENGPHEPRMVPCWRCGGAGWHGTDDSWPCRTCDTEGEIPVDEVDC